ncbi:MAG: O-antigen ligase family protein [Bacteroidetes bacterium]|nr:O-antigen ligase family protein [Bacteroidota bacterium]
MSLKRIFDWLVALFIFLIPVSPFASVRVQILAIGLAIILNVFYGFKSNFLSKTWDIGIYLLVLIFGLLYSEDIDTGMRVLETSFSFIGIPIILNSYKDFGISRLKKLLYSFTLGLFVACVLCLINAFVSYFKSGSPNVFFFYELTRIIDSHPTYLAYYLIFSITFCLYLLDLENGFQHAFVLSSLVLFFFLMLLLTGGQTTFVSVLLVFSFFILKFFLEKRTKSRKLIFVLTSAMTASMLVFSSFDNNNEREKLNDSWDRMVVWKSALKASSNILLGEGTGDYKIVLNEYYRAHGMEDFAKNNFNSHNQFVQILFANGILGLIALLLLIARPLFLAFKKDDAFGILIFFPFIIYGMTEVFLGRYQGVAFFSLAHQLLIIYYMSIKSTLPLQSV